MSRVTGKKRFAKRNSGETPTLRSRHKNSEGREMKEREREEESKREGEER